MSYITGSYVLKTCSNLAEMLPAMSVVPLTQEDIALAGSSENKSVVCYQELADGVKATVTSNLMKKNDGEWSLKFGEDMTMPGTEASVSAVKCGTNQLTETLKMGDCVTTTKMTFSSLGARGEVSTSAKGYLGSFFMEREQVSMLGYFVLEKQENADAIWDSANISKEQMAKLTANMSCRLVDLGDGLLSLTDYFGDGSQKTITYRLGEEFEYSDDMLGVSGTHLVTQVAPNKVSYVAKDKKKGTTEVWEGTFCQDGMMWSTEKNGTTAKLYYRRYADIEGCWRMVNSTGMDNMLASVGTPKDMIAKMVADPAVTTMKYLGGGMWSYKTNSKVMPMDEVHFRSGEETSITYPGIGAATFNTTLTKDGAIGVVKMGGKIIKSVGKIGKEFYTIEEEIVGEPGTKCTIILAKV